VWQDASFRRVWSAQVWSDIGDWASRLTMSLMVFGATESAFMAALVLTVSLLPALGPGQWLTFRMGLLPRRTIFVGTELTRAALLVALALFPGVALALLVSFATGLVRVPFVAQRAAMVPEIVGQDQIVAATKVQQVTTNLTILLGYAAGGLLGGLLTTSMSLLFGAAAFAVSAALLASIVHPANRTPGTPETAPRLSEGRAALRTLPAVTAAAALSVIALGAGVAIESQAVPLAHTLPPVNLGGAPLPEEAAAAVLLIGCTLVAAVTAAAVPPGWRERALLTWTAALIAGPAFAGALGFLVGGAWMPAIALVVCGAMFGAVGPANAVAAIQLPAHQRAAVFALVIGALYAAQAVAGPFAGLVFDEFGPRGLAGLLVVPIIATVITHVLMTRRVPPSHAPSPAVPEHA
jgi:hypothetical protein